MLNSMYCMVTYILRNFLSINLGKYYLHNRKIKKNIIINFFHNAVKPVYRQPIHSFDIIKADSVEPNTF